MYTTEYSAAYQSSVNVLLSLCERIVSKGVPMIFIVLVQNVSFIKHNRPFIKLWLRLIHYNIPVGCIKLCKQPCPLVTLTYINQHPVLTGSHAPSSDFPALVNFNVLNEIEFACLPMVASICFKANSFFVIHITPVKASARGFRIKINPVTKSLPT